MNAYLCIYVCIVYVYICAYDINPNPDNISVPGGRALERVGMNPSCEVWHWKQIAFVENIEQKCVNTGLGRGSLEDLGELITEGFARQSKELESGMFKRTTESRVIITSLVLIQLKRELELIICCCIKQIKCNDWPLGEKRF